MSALFAVKSLSHAWEACLRRDSGAAVVWESGRWWTRAELEASAQALAKRLPEGLRGRRVALAEPNGLRWLAVFIALQRAGAVPVLLDYSESVERLAAAAASLRCACLWSKGEWTELGAGLVSRRRDLCLVKVTSGSTGTPRGLVFTQSQMLADGAQVCRGMGVRAADVNLAVIPFGHSYGLGNLVLPLLVQGSPVACVESPLPACLAAVCRNAGATVFPAVPALLRTLVESGENAADFESLRLVLSAGSPISPAEARAFRERFGRPVHVFYGSSETGGISYDPTGRVAEDGRGVGPLLPGVALRKAAAGRVRVSSPAVLGKGGFSPADRVGVADDGCLSLLGRVGRMVKLGGRRLDLSGLEQAFLRIPGIRGAIIEPHPERAEALAALVATDLPPRELKLRLSGQLPSWQVPARLRVVAELPLSARGKPDRARAREWLRS